MSSQEYEMDISGKVFTLTNIFTIYGLLFSFVFDPWVIVMKINILILRNFSNWKSFKLFKLQFWFNLSLTMV